MRQSRVLALVLLSLCAIMVSCAESSSGGQSVSIPRVVVDCKTNNCRNNIERRPRITVYITAASCSDPTFGYTIAASTESLSCTGIVGCYGEITGWIDADEQSVTTLPAGTYTLCGRIDFDKNYPNSNSDDSNFVGENVAIGTVTSDLILDTWTEGARYKYLATTHYNAP